MADTADRLAGGDLDARVTPDGPPETRSVAIALNRLAARIIELLHAEREAVADLSHRLRTPVTALRLDVEALPAGTERDRLESDVGSLTRSIDAVITEARRPIREGIDARCDATEVVAARIDFWSALAEDEGRRVDTSLPTRPLLVASTATDLAATVDALLGNVFAHTPAGTPFTCEPRRAAGRRRCSPLRTPDQAGDWPTRRPEAVREPGRPGSVSTSRARTAAASGGSLERQDAPEGGAVVLVRLGRPGE